jgi:hypothetical protein
MSSLSPIPRYPKRVFSRDIGTSEGAKLDWLSDMRRGQGWLVLFAVIFFDDETYHRIKALLPTILPSTVKISVND